MKLQAKLFEYRNSGKAILATNFYNLETLQGILRAAAEVQSPIILQLSKNSIEYIGLDMAIEMARRALKDFQVEGWVHLDHGDSSELTKRCLDVGFDSVMIDASEKSFEENVRISSEVVEQAKKYDAHVEAELGFVAKLGQSQKTDEYTQPEDAKRFVELTGVDSLAVAIGSAHGFYKEIPTLQIELLDKIRKATNANLVLHGSSGIPSEMVLNAVSHGITKINLATEIKDAFMKTLKAQLATTSEIDLRKVFPVATNSVTDIVKAKLLVLK